MIDLNSVLQLGQILENEKHSFLVGDDRGLANINRQTCSEEGVLGIKGLRLSSCSWRGWEFLQTFSWDSLSLNGH